MSLFRTVWHLFFSHLGVERCTEISESAHRYSEVDFGQLFESLAALSGRRTNTDDRNGSAIFCVMRFRLFAFRLRLALYMWVWFFPLSILRGRTLVYVHRVLIGFQLRKVLGTLRARNACFSISDSVLNCFTVFPSSDCSCTLTFDLCFNMGFLLINLT